MKLTISTFRRFGLAVLLALAGGLFWVSVPAQAATPAMIHVITDVTTTCHTGPMTDCSGSGWNYEKASNTLVLNNFSGRRIYANGDLKIRLKGSNTLTSDGNANLIAVSPMTAAGDGGVTITTDPGEDGSLALNKTGGDLGVISAADEVRIAGKAVVTVNHTSSSDGTGATQVIRSLCDQVIVYGNASLTVNAQSRRKSGTGLPDSIFRAKKYIIFDTSGTVTANVKAVAESDQSRMVVFSSTETSFSTKHLIFRGSGIYQFSAPKQVLVANNWGVIGGLVSGGQTIQIPTGASFDSNGILVDATNNDIRATTNKLVISKVPIVVTHNLTINCGVGGTCSQNHANPYNDGETATITLTPAAGKRVKTVTGATKVNDTTYTVVMDADKTVAVEFKDDAPALSATVSVDKTTLKQNESLTVTISNLDASYEGKTVVFLLNSTPFKLGEATVFQGRAILKALVPCSVKPGDHTVTAKIGGVTVGNPVTVKVLSSPACTAASNTPNNAPNAPNTGDESGRSIIALVVSLVLTLGVAGLVRRKMAKA